MAMFPGFNNFYNQPGMMPGMTPGMMPGMFGMNFYDPLAPNGAGYIKPFVPATTNMLDLNAKNAMEHAYTSRLKGNIDGGNVGGFVGAGVAALGALAALPLLAVPGVNAFVMPLLFAGGSLLGGLAGGMSGKGNTLIGAGAGAAGALAASVALIPGIGLPIALLGSPLLGAALGSFGGSWLGERIFETRAIRQDFFSKDGGKFGIMDGDPRRIEYMDYGFI